MSKKKGRARDPKDIRKPASIGYRGRYVQQPIQGARMFVEKGGTELLKGMSEEKQGESGDLLPKWVELQPGSYTKVVIGDESVSARVVRPRKVPPSQNETSEAKQSDVGERGSDQSGEQDMAEKDYVSGREMDAHLKAIEQKLDSSYKMLEGKLDSFFKDFSDKESKLFAEVKQSADRIELNNKEILGRVEANNRSTKSTVIGTAFATVVGLIAAIAGVFVIYSDNFDNQVRSIDEKTALRVEAVKQDVGQLKVDLGGLKQDLSLVSSSQGEIRNSLEAISGSLARLSEQKESMPDSSPSQDGSQN